MTRTALILGATGGIGSAVAKALHAQGWQITALTRDLAKGKNYPHYNWLKGDAMNAEDVIAAAEGADVIFHGVNPPGYQNWDKVVLPMIDATIAAARKTGARIILPANVYNYDPAQTDLITEFALQNAISRKGQIRIALEQRLRNAAPEVHSLILRAGDFFGPDQDSGWLPQGMMPKGPATKRITKLATSHGHSWAYVPDAAVAFVKLLDADLQPFEMVQFGGYYETTGMEMVDAIRSATGNTKKIKHFPWWVVSLLAPFNRFMREVKDIEALWHHPMQLDNTRLEQLIGPEPHRSLDLAVAESLGLSA